MALEVGSRFRVTRTMAAHCANWYLTRPGFWHGALGPAACWAGGAIGLIDAVCTLNKRDPHYIRQSHAEKDLAAIPREAG
jgi:hypothetical protein